MNLVKLHSALLPIACAAMSVITGCGDDASNEPKRGLNDAQIADVLQTANTGEITQAETANPRLNVEHARTFAQMMIDDHSGSNDELNSLLDSQNLVVESNTVSAALKQQSDASVAALEDASDESIDSQYIDAQVEAHDGLLAIIDQRLLPDVRDADLEAFIVRTRAVVDTHWQEAKAVQSELTAASTP